MDFKERLKWELDKKDMRVKELAAISGVKKQTLDNYLSTHSYQPSAENAVKIAAALGVSVEYLIVGKEPNSTENTNTEPRNFTEPEKITSLQRKLLKQMQKIPDADLKLVLALVNAILKKNSC